MFEHDAAWQFIIETAFDPRTREVARAAFERPCLRALYPYTSLSNLHFSRNDHYPWDDPFPYVLVKPVNGYQARAQDRSILAEGDLPTIIDLVEKLVREKDGA